MEKTEKKSFGTLVELLDAYDFFEAQEGELNQYYGKIRNGKTYAATADAIADLNAGQVVYCSWKIKWDGYDERKIFWYRLLGVLGLKRNFKVYPKENLHYFPLVELVKNGKFIDTIAGLTDCIIYLDEGHLGFDSYEKTNMDMRKRAVALHTGHYNRTINIISQRPTAIHVSLRANVNRFYKCEKEPSFFSFIFGRIRFVRTEYQDMAGESVDETKEPESVRVYWSDKKIFDAYDTRYLRAGAGHSQKQEAKLYHAGWWEQIKALF